MVPVFMIGTQRSGSNLLRLMINQLKDVSSPHPPHIFERMYPLLDHYGDLGIKLNFMQLIKDVCCLVELNPVQWSDVTLDPDDILNRCHENSLVAIHGAVYDIYAESRSASAWCCKSLSNINYINDIENYYSSPKYIYLYRDGRDVALSFKKAVVGEKHIYNIANEWTSTQEIALKLKQCIVSDRFFSISYEELTKNPEASARLLCEFLAVDYSHEVLDFHKTQDAKSAAGSSKLWSNVTSPVMNNNTKKYKTGLTVDELKIFESVAGHVMDELGYSRDYIDPGKEINFTENEINSFNQKNDLMKSNILTTIDRDDMERRKRQSGFIDSIKSRKVACC